MQTRWCKTEAGRNEIQQRTRRLPAGLRSILLLVDGQRSDDELQAMMSGLHAPDDALGQLAADGLIERRSGAASMLAAVELPRDHVAVVLLGDQRLGRRPQESPVLPVLLDDRVAEGIDLFHNSQIAQALDRMLEPIQVEAAKLEVALPPIVQGRRRWE